MFIFGDNISTTSWYNEGPVSSGVKGQPTSGSIDTSGIDFYRQGVELTQQQHWTNGIVKIHAGQTNHILRRNIFGQDGPRINDDPVLGTSWSKDNDNFNPVKYLKSQVSEFIGLTFPIITSDFNQAENFVMNGVIEPIAIRSIISFFSTYGDHEPTGIKGSVMTGNVDVLSRSEPLVHVHKLELTHQATPFIDMIDMIGLTPTAAFRDISTVTSTPFADMDSRSRAEYDLYAIETSDMNEAIGELKFDTENYIPVGSISPTSGFVFDNVVGTDSLSFGGMTY